MHRPTGFPAAPPLEPCPACGAAAPPGTPACPACGEPLAVDLDALPLPPLPDGGLPAVMPDWLRDEGPPLAEPETAAAAPSRPAGDASPPRPRFVGEGVARPTPLPPPVVADWPEPPVQGGAVNPPAPEAAPPGAPAAPPRPQPPAAAAGQSTPAARGEPSREAPASAVGPMPPVAAAPAPFPADDDPATFLTEDDLPAWLRAIAAGADPAALPVADGGHASMAPAAADSGADAAISRPSAPPAAVLPTPVGSEAAAPLYLPRAAPSLLPVAPPLAPRAPHPIPPSPAAAPHDAPLGARRPAPGTSERPAPMQEGVAAGLATILILFLAAVIAVLVWRAAGGW